MFLSRLYISNFRSIKELDLEFHQGKNVIIGKNNAGKSNIVRALDIVMGGFSPDYSSSDNITALDFHTYRETDEMGSTLMKQANELYILCQLTRAEDEPLNWEEINKCRGFSYHGDKGSGEGIRLDVNDLGTDFERIFDVDEEKAPKVYVDGKHKGQRSFEQVLEPMTHFAYAFRAKLTERGVEKDLRFLFREADDKRWILAFKASVRNDLLQSAIIPAFRDPASQLRTSSWTWYGKLLKHLTKDCHSDKGLEGALVSLKSEADRIFEGINSTLKSDVLSVSFPGTSINFRFVGASNADLIGKCAIVVDDGHESNLSDKGAGIQSATIVGLFSYYVREVNTRGSALLCIEEPELYLHPHARRVLSDRFDAFLGGGRNQVIVTTHGIEFLRTSTDTFRILSVRKTPEHGTTAQSVDARAFLKLLVDNNQNELFFADKVILCEGLDEHIIRAVAQAKFPGELDRQNVSIISVGGKDKFSEVSRQILKVGIDCYVLADFDFLLRDTPTSSLEGMSTEYFRQKYFPADKDIQSSIAKYRNHLRGLSAEKFRNAKTSSEFNEPELDLRLQGYRRFGIGILSGEIENLSSDTSLMKPGSKKLSYEAVFRMREMITSGKSIDELIDTTEIVEFLQAVLRTST